MAHFLNDRESDRERHSGQAHCGLMLPLTRQNEYRSRYRQHRLSWRSSNNVFEQIVRDSITPTTRLLDAGSGRGGLVELIHNQVFSATALDPDLHSLLEHRAPTVYRVCSLAETVPFPAETFDLVISAWVLEHLADPQRVFNEMYRILKPGGRYVFLTPNARHPLLIANALMRVFPALQSLLVSRLYARTEADTFSVYYRANTRQALDVLCRRAGFQLDLRYISDPTYTAFNEALFRCSTVVEDLIPVEFKIHLVGIASKT